MGAETACTGSQNAWHIHLYTPLNILKNITLCNILINLQLILHFLQCKLKVILLYCWLSADQWLGKTAMNSMPLS